MGGAEVAGGDLRLAGSLRYEGRVQIPAQEAQRCNDDRHMESRQLQPGLLRLELLDREARGLLHYGLGMIKVMLIAILGIGLLHAAVGLLIAGLLVGILLIVRLLGLLRLGISCIARLLRIIGIVAALRIACIRLRGIGLIRVLHRLGHLRAVALHGLRVIALLRLLAIGRLPPLGKSPVGRIELIIHLYVLPSCVVGKKMISVRCATFRSYRGVGRGSCAPCG